MKHNRWTAGAIAAGVVMTTTGVALHAKPDRGDAPKGDAPKMDHPRRDDRGPDPRDMTPEQRQQERDSQLREMLTDAGFTNKTTQDEIIAFATEQDEARRDVHDKARQINDALHDNATDAQLAALLTAYRTTEKTAQTRREVALKTLDAKIKFSAQPKLDALLVTRGITGEAGPPPRGGMERRGGRDEPRGFEH